MLTLLIQVFHGLPIPVYFEITEKRDGPVQSPWFTNRVYAGDGSFLGEGTGKTMTKAKMALENIRESP